MEKNIFKVRFLGQCENTTNIVIEIPNGITKEQAEQLSEAFDEEIDKWGEKNDGDFEHFNYDIIINDVCSKYGICYHYPKVDHIIYI